MSNAAFENGVLLHPDGMETTCLFQSLIECRDRIGGIGPEEPHDVSLGLSGNDGGEDISPAVSAVDVAVAEGAASSMPNWLNRKFGW